MFVSCAYRIVIRDQSDSSLIFPLYLINSTIFCEKKFLSLKHVFWFCLKLSFAIFLNIRRIQRYMIINVYLSSCKVPIILVTF